MIEGGGGGEEIQAPFVYAFPQRMAIYSPRHSPQRGELRHLTLGGTRFTLGGDSQKRKKKPTALQVTVKHRQVDTVR